MVDLTKRFKSFKAKEYSQHEHKFKQLKSSQNPHTLFIGCADSRLMPALITESEPGELFVIRNVANVVPPYTLEPASIGISSAIEYALVALKVQSIVVCGHSNCGGCKATFLSEEELSSLPHTRQWVSLVSPANEQVMQEQGNTKPIEELTIEVEQQNIRNQLENLKDYPTVKERLAAGDLKFYGWYFDIENASILQLNQQTLEFEEL